MEVEFIKANIHPKMGNNYQDSVRLVPSIVVVVTKLGAKAKCD